MAVLITRRHMLGATGAAAALAATGTGVAYANETVESSPAAKLPMIGPVGGEKIHVMTYNIRLVGDNDPEPKRWSYRKKHVINLIKQERPTIVGTQEGGLLNQVADLEEALGGNYAPVALGRSENERGQTVAIFYDTDRLTKLDEGHRWFSPTPHVPGSTGWGNEGARMMSWAQLKDNVTGKTFVHVNTHLDHRSPKSRRKSAQAIKNWLKKRGWPPSIVTGDFNCPYDSEPFDIMTKGGPRSAWHAADKRLTPAYSTHNHWNAEPRKNNMIDWIINSKDFAVHRVGVNTWVPPNGNVASDHWPVQAVLSFA